MPEPMEKPPLSRLFAVSELRDTGHEIVVVAKPAEREALARLNGLVAVESLEADFRIRRRGRNGLDVKGTLRAKVIQSCVVSLEPFEAAISESFDVRFEPQGHAQKPPVAQDIEFATLPEMDPADPIVGGRVDLGALAGEYLALGLDPYPRKPGARFPDEFAPRPDDRPSPFAVLKGGMATKGHKT